MLETNGERHSLYTLDLRSGRWAIRGEACAGRLARLGDDLVQLGGRSSCLLEPAAGRCTELALMKFRPAEPIVSIGDGVLLRVGYPIIGSFLPYGLRRYSSEFSFSLLRRATGVSFSENLGKHGNVRGIAAIISEPWGGPVRPTTISPAAIKRLVIRKGERNSATRPIAEVTTDEFGLFDLSLPPGSYCLVDQEKASIPRPVSAASAACLKNWWSGCDARFRVPEPQHNPVVIHVTFRQGRPPCYTGPEPP